MFINRETLANPPSRMATRKRSLLVLAICLVTLSHMMAYASLPPSQTATKPTTLESIANSNDQIVEESKKVKYVTVEVKEADKSNKMSTELMMAAPKMDFSPPPPPMMSKLSGTELMMAPKMEIMEPMKSIKPMSPPEVSMVMVPMMKVKDHSGAQMMEDLSEAAGHKKYMLVKKKPKMKKIKMEVYKPKMKYKKIKMKVPVKKMKKKKVKGYMVKKHHEHF